MNKHFIQIQEKISKAGWQISEELWAYLSDYEKSFLAIEFSDLNTLDYYRQRLVAVGFDGLDTVLDAGCGMGQWSIALACNNNRLVHGVDINVGRLFVAREISHLMGKTNIHYQYSELEKLPFSDATFDGIFCYGVFMFTHMPIVMKEFARVLKPGGRLYINVNSLGWYAHLLLDRGLKKNNFHMVKVAIKMVIKSWLGQQKDVLVSPLKLRKMLESYSFENLRIGPEGTCSFEEKPLPPTKYRPTYYKLPGVTEAIGVKK